MGQGRKAAIGFIFVTLLIDVIGFGIIIPVMPALIMELKGVNNSEASAYGGYLLAVFAAMQFLFAPVLGNLSDQYGRRKILLISLFGFGIDYLFLAFAPSYEWLFVGRIVAGIMGASFTTASAYIADISTSENRAQNFGMIGAAFGLGFIIGPAIGGLLGSNFGPRAPFIAAAIFTLLNWLYGFFILPESLAKENRRKFDWKRANPIGAFNVFFKYRGILGLVASIILIYMAGHAVQSTWNYYTTERFGWDADQIGYSLTFVGLMVALVQGGLIRITNPILGQERSVYIGLALYAIGFILFGMANKGWMMYAVLIPYCLGGICGPSLQGIISGQVPANEQGELQGALTSLMSLTSFFGPLLMTGIFAYYTRPEGYYLPGAPMYLAAILTIICGVLAWLSLKKGHHLE